MNLLLDEENNEDFDSEENLEEEDSSQQIAEDFTDFQEDPEDLLEEELDEDEITGELAEDESTDGIIEGSLPEAQAQNEEAEISSETDDSAPAEEDLALNQTGSEEDTNQTVEQGEIIEGLSIITNIRYSAELDKISIDSSSPLTYETRTNTDNNQFILEIPNSTLAENLKQKPFIMKEFSSHIALLQADQKDSTTSRILIQMREESPAFPEVEITADGVLQISPPKGGSFSFK